MLDTVAVDVNVDNVDVHLQKMMGKGEQASSAALQKYYYSVVCVLLPLRNEPGERCIGSLLLRFVDTRYLYCTSIDVNVNVTSMST